jgi:phenylacetate-CoA ligase
MPSLGRDPDEFANRDAVEAIQRRKLASLGERLAENQEWVDHFASAGMRVQDLGKPGALASAPTLEKADLRPRYPYPFLTVPVARIERFCATSGTTGLPVLFGFTHRDYDVTLVRQLSRIFRTVGIVPGDLAYQGYGYGLWIGGPSMDATLKAFGVANLPVGPGRGELMVNWLKDLGPTVTTMSPLWLMTLINLARSSGIDPKTEWKLRLGLFGGQSVSATFRNELEAQMPDGFKAHNVYGTTEAGGPVVSVSCPHSHAADEMHLINDDSVLTEIVDPKTLAPVGPGEIGEIVITTLDKEASPVVRWRTHDLVRRAERPFDCPCGRAGYPLIGRIIGRSDDMLKVRGAIVYPTQVEDVIASVEGTVKEAWQIYIDRETTILDAIEVAIERQSTARRAASEIATEVSAHLHARLGLTCPVQCHEEGSLPRYEAKATRVLIRERQQTETYAGRRSGTAAPPG